MLFKIGYDFVRDSQTSYNKISQLNTLEVMITVPIEPKFFREIIWYIWKKQRFIVECIIHQIMDKEGPFVDLMKQMRFDVRNLYLKELSAFIFQKQEEFSDIIEKHTDNTDE